MAKNSILVRSKLKETKSKYVKLYSKNKVLHTFGHKLVVIHRKLGEFKETQSICKKIIKVAPKNTVAHHILGPGLKIKVNALFLSSACSVLVQPYAKRFYPVILKYKVPVSYLTLTSSNIH